MNNGSSKISRTEDGKWLYWCPGCKCGHWFQTAPYGPPTWELTGSLSCPTVRASILTWWTDDGLDAEGNRLRVPKDHLCHSYITEGQIQFLDDCTHELAGQTVPMREF